MAKDPVQNLPTQSQPATQHRQQVVEFEGVSEPPKQLPPAKPAEPEKYTRCFLVSHPAFGAFRVYDGTAEDAILAFIAKRCPNAEAEFRKHVQVAELVFRPAETEAHKPHGWVAPKGKIALPRQ